MRICIGGVTGWVGRKLCAAVLEHRGFELTGAISRATAGKSVAQALNLDSGVMISSTISEALTNQPDVYVDFTSPNVVKKHVHMAIARKCNVVIGTSGLSEAELVEIGLLAEENRIGVLAAANFAVTAVLAQKCAEFIARHIKRYEIVDFGPVTKTDAPSGTARELAFSLVQNQPAELDVPLDRIHGVTECRGGNVNGVQVHSVRLPSYSFGFDIIFGLGQERLTLKHETGPDSEPYVAGAILAIEKVRTFTGLRRGLKSILDV